MTIWLLALVLIAAVAALGYRQSAIRVAFSFIGIIVAAFLAVPLGHLVSKILPKFTLKEPLLIWALGPVIAFIIISALFKVAAAPVHQKVDVYYKYHAGDLRLALWERLSRRLGLCLGILNGVAYAVLLAFLIYVPSYATIQLATSDEDPKWMRFLNVLGHGLHSSGMDKVARSIDRISDTDYRMIDLGATVYRNPLVQARLRNYPPFLRLAELPEFMSLGSDNDFQQTWLRITPFMEFINHPKIQAIRSNTELLKDVWYTTRADINDIPRYLGPENVSAKYDAIKILGRWTFDVPSAIAAIRRAKPNISSREMQGLRQYMDAAFGKTSLAVRPDNKLLIKSIPGMALPASAAAAAAAGTPNPQTLQGEWRDATEGKYQVSVAGANLLAAVEGERLIIKTPGIQMVFNREY
jgi:hypothetical protein